MVKDWDQIDENGLLTDLYRLEDVCTQTAIIDTGLDFEDAQEVILSFSEICANSE